MRALQERSPSIGGELERFTGAHLIERFVPLGDDVKAVEDVQCSAAVFAYDSQVCFHMSEHTNSMPAHMSLPYTSKNLLKLLTG